MPKIEAYICDRCKVDVLDQLEVELTIGDIYEIDTDDPSEADKVVMRDNLYVDGLDSEEIILCRACFKLFETDFLKRPMSVKREA